MEGVVGEVGYRVALDRRPRVPALRPGGVVELGCEGTRDPSARVGTTVVVGTTTLVGYPGPKGRSAIFHYC